MCLRGLVNFPVSSAASCSALGVGLSQTSVRLGGWAGRLCTGLQIREDRFDSGTRLQDATVPDRGRCTMATKRHSWHGGSGKWLINHIGRGEKIRTSDPLHPMQVRYQAAPRPVLEWSSISSRPLELPLRIIPEIATPTRLRLRSRASTPQKA